MKLILSTAVVLLSAAALAETLDAKPTADQLLHDVVAQLPTDPIHVSGTLLVRKRRGVPIAKLQFELDAHWGGAPASASYTIRDAFGQSLEKLTLTHGGDTPPQYASGDPLKVTPLSSLSSAIQNTDLSWTDLSLAYLWWPNGKIIGEESIKTFDCYIVELAAPNTPDAESTSYASVRLWISKKTHLMLQAEGYDSDGKIERRLWVRSCKKIDDQWMIQDMEIQHYPVKHRTKLTVTNVTTPTS